jgi:plastocyanin
VQCPDHQKWSESGCCAQFLYRLRKRLRERETSAGQSGLRSAKGKFLDRTIGRIIDIRGIRGAILAAVALASCGGSPSSPPSGGSGGSGNSSITITITAAGVSPKQLQVAPGTRVLFTNNDVKTREMFSDPHPEHTDCPEINNVGDISPGQTKETGNLNVVRTCGYHDHLNSEDTRYRGSIIIR